MRQTLLNMIMIMIFIILSLIATYLFLTIYTRFKRRKTHSHKKPELAQRIDNTINLLKIVDSLIELEMVNQVKETILIQKDKYNFRRLDDDCKQISLKVYKSLSPELFSKKDYEITITGDYLMSYITKTAMITLSEYMIQYNSKFMNL